jgi:hypothetical protein
MARTQTTEQQIKDRVLTGASFNPELGFYDETFSYISGDSVIWKNEKYICNTNITGTNEGDLSSAPDISGNWERQPNAKYSVYPSASQGVGTSRSDLELDSERYVSPYFSLSGYEITVQSTGSFVISVSVTTDNSSTTRSSSQGYLQIDTGSGYTDIPNVRLDMYNRDGTHGRTNASMTIPYDFNAGDKIKVQVISSNTNVSTLAEGCNVTIFALDTMSGPRGPMGPVGPAGDIEWRGAWVSGTYNENDAVEYQGSSYVCLANGTTTTPPGTAGVDWDLIAQKGADGSGSTIIVQDSGTGVPNTPHGTLNFIDEIQVTDAGGGVADVSVIFPKNTYMMSVWAEENAALGNNTYEWAYGNGANTAAGGGVTMYVPAGYKCELVAMSLTLRQGTATVESLRNTTLNGSNGDVTVSSGTTATNDSFTPIQYNNGDVINFRTTTQSGTGGPNVVTAWFKYTEL